MRRPSLSSSLSATLLARRPLLWINEQRRPMEAARHTLSHNLADVHAAERKWRGFASLLAAVFPELIVSGGVIESTLVPADRLQQALSRNVPHQGRWLIKGDHNLPIAGSIKARGGIFEVLLHAEELAASEGMLGPDQDRMMLCSDAARKLFSQYSISVGSTGNLGLSIGIMAAALGFKTTVHMSAEAKDWKKQRLRDRGVAVVEHAGDFSAAVGAGRLESATMAKSYFVDDESSSRLFLGYSVAALRLKAQLGEIGIQVDEDHPLFVYLPCGVGGAPSGIIFGIRALFGDAAHCFFAEPTESPCMLVRLASGSPMLSVHDVGLNNKTEADGLAVARASELAASFLDPLSSGGFTTTDEELLENLYVAKESENLAIEPSAAAAFNGPKWITASDAGDDYQDRWKLGSKLHQATHVLWTTGGAHLPEAEYLHFWRRGQRAFDSARKSEIFKGTFRL